MQKETPGVKPISQLKDELQTKLNRYEELLNYSFNAKDTFAKLYFQIISPSGIETVFIDSNDCFELDRFVIQFFTDQIFDIEKQIKSIR